MTMVKILTFNKFQENCLFKITNIFSKLENDGLCFCPILLIISPIKFICSVENYSGVI